MSHHGKYHYLPKGTDKSRCGQWKVWPNEWKYIIRTTKDKLRKGKICKNCEMLIKISERSLND